LIQINALQGPTSFCCTQDIDDILVRLTPVAVGRLAAFDCFGMRHMPRVSRPSGTPLADDIDMLVVGGAISSAPSTGTIRGTQNLPIGYRIEADASGVPGSKAS
jgi:hypothetical protein